MPVSRCLPPFGSGRRRARGGEGCWHSAQPTTQTYSHQHKHQYLTLTTQCNSGRRGRVVMQLVEQHHIPRSDPRFAAIDQAAFAAKNLYNLANYHVRQSFINEGTYLSYVEVFRRVKAHEAYTALPRKVSNAILIQLHRN